VADNQGREIGNRVLKGRAAGENNGRQLESLTIYMKRPPWAVQPPVSSEKNREKGVGTRFGQHPSEKGPNIFSRPVANDVLFAVVGQQKGAPGTNPSYPVLV
jgi:hypothetical protein